MSHECDDGFPWIIILAVALFMTCGRVDDLEKRIIELETAQVEEGVKK